jgi:hypothetical protein
MRSGGNGLAVMAINLPPDLVPLRVLVAIVVHASCKNRSSRGGSF